MPQLSLQEEEAALGQREYRERELALLQREEDLKARELELRRARLANMREGDERNSANSGTAGPLIPQSQPHLRPREKKTSFRTQQPPSPLHTQSPSPIPNNTPRQPYSQHSYSTSHLVPPSPSATSAHMSHSQDGRSSFDGYHSNSRQSSQQSLQSRHPPYCTCPNCSAGKLSSSPMSSRPLDIRPVTKLIELRPDPPGKPKSSWMKRLSMPVGNAFNLDSKKGISHIPGVGMMGGPGKNGLFLLDGRKNISNTALHNRALEDERRSYEPGRIGNRNITNLDPGRRE